MTQHMVRYRVKPDQVARNEELVRAVFDELDEAKPAGIRYAAFKLDDGVSFIHLIGRDDTGEHNPPPRLQALKEFHAGVRERCDDAPTRVPLTELGSYRVFEKAPDESETGV